MNGEHKVSGHADGHDMLQGHYPVNGRPIKALGIEETGQGRVIRGRWKTNICEELAYASQVEAGVWPLAPMTASTACNS
ncbi:hypothetical protein Ancab_035342 [Ancistrocladus abbreviatus]